MTGLQVDGSEESRILRRDMSTTVYLIRHAQSQPSADVHTAQWPLSNRGQVQAERLAGPLATLGIERLYSSPYARCLQTLEPFARRNRLPVTKIDDLREMLIVNEPVDDFGVVWRQVWEDFGYAWPGCESAAQAQARFVAAVTSIAQQSRERTIGVGAHGMVIGLFLNDLDPEFGREGAEEIMNPDAIRIVTKDGRFEWDRSFELPELAEIASHPDETPYEAGAEDRSD